MLLGASLRSGLGAIVGASVRPSASQAPAQLMPRALPSLPPLAASLARPAQVRHAGNMGPRRIKHKKAHKGRVPARIGGSIKGTTLTEGTYGIRALYPTRMTAQQLEACHQTIRRELRAVKGAQMWMKVFPDIPVCVKGDESRMGGGKGSFDHWMCRVPVGRVVFEIGGPVEIKAEIAREILRIGTATLPVPMEFIDKNSLPRLGNMLVPKEWKPIHMLSHQERASLWDHSEAIPRHLMAPARNAAKAAAEKAAKEIRQNKNRLRLGQKLRFEAQRQATAAARRLTDFSAGGYEPQDATAKALKAMKYTGPDTRTAALSSGCGLQEHGA